MQTIRELKIRGKFTIGTEATDVKIEFTTAKKLRDFVHSGERLVTINKNLIKIIKINKLRHTSMEATIQKITLREYNLERLLL